MAKKLSELPTANNLTGTELVEVTQSSASRKAAVSELAEYFDSLTGTVEDRGLQNQVYISFRTDGKAGIGTAEHPFNGGGGTQAEAAANFDALLAAIDPSINIILGEGTFYTSGVINGAATNVKDYWHIQGRGKLLTTIKLKDNALTVAGSRVVIGGFGGGLRNSFQISDLTIDANRANQPAYVSNLNASELLAMTAYVRTGKATNVRVMNTWSKNGVTGNEEGFPFHFFHGGGSHPEHTIEMVNCDNISNRGYGGGLGIIDQEGGTYKGTLNNCYTYDNPAGACFGMSGSTNGQIINCRAEDSGGLNFDTFPNDNLEIAGCIIRRAIGFGILSNSGYVNVNVRIHDNFIETNATTGQQVLYLGGAAGSSYFVWGNTLIQKRAAVAAVLLVSTLTGSFHHNTVDETTVSDTSACSMAVYDNYDKLGAPILMGRLAQKVVSQTTEVTGSNSLVWAQTLRNPGNFGGTGYGVGLKLQMDIGVGSPGYWWGDDKWAGVMAVATATFADQVALDFYTQSNLGTDPGIAPTAKMRLRTGLNVGGTSDPGAGNIAATALYDEAGTPKKVFDLANRSIYAPDGTTQVADFTGSPNGTGAYFLAGAEFGDDVGCWISDAGEAFFGVVTIGNSQLVSDAVSSAQVHFPNKAGTVAFLDDVTGLFDFKGSTNCSANPNYPAALKGDAYVVSVAGKIGGGSGVSVDAGDVFFAIADNAGGTQASVGTSWTTVEHNITGALVAANNLSDVASAAAARTNLALVPGTNVQVWSNELDNLAGLSLDNYGMGLLELVNTTELLTYAGFNAAFRTFIGTPSSANLRGLLTDETGTGAAVFATSPALTTPDIGNATGGSLTLSGALSVNASTFLTHYSTPASGVGIQSGYYGPGPYSFLQSYNYTTPGFAALRIDGSTLGLNVGSAGLTTVGGNLTVSGGTLTGGASGLSLQPGTLTTTQPVSITQTWNASGVTFKAFDVSITDTASSSASSFFKFSVGGSPKFEAVKDGRLYVANQQIANSNGNLFAGTGTIEAGGPLTIAAGGTNQNITLTPSGTGSVIVPTGSAAKPSIAFSAHSTMGFWDSGNAINIVIGGVNKIAFGYDSSSQVKVNSAGQFAWGNNTVLDAQDTGLNRNAAGVVEINNGTAGTYRDLLARSIFSSSINGASGAYFPVSLVTSVGGGSSNFYLSDSTGFATRSGNRIGWSSSASQAELAMDTALGRNAAGVVEINNGTAGTYRDLKLRNLIADNTVRLKGFTVATLPASPTAGDTAYITDGNGLVLGDVVAGGGSQKCKVWFNGTDWTVAGV